MPDKKVQLAKLTAKDYVFESGTDSGLPPDWKKYVGDNLSKFELQRNGDSIMAGDTGGYVGITTVPPRKPGKPDDPDGHTELMYLTERTRNKVLNYPGFPQPVTKPKVPKHEVRDAGPGKGLGVFATCDMYPGDFIWAERPFVVKPNTIVQPKGFCTGKHHTASQITALKLHATELSMEAIVNRLTPERKAGYMSLATSYPEEGFGPYLGIVRLNQLGISMAEANPGDDPQDAFYQYAAIGVDLSRTNHSCVPNIFHDFDFASFSLRVYAWGRIKAGDELVWSYVPTPQTTAERQKQISLYGFKCVCWICKKGATDASVDERWNEHINHIYGCAKWVITGLLDEDFGPKPLHRMTPSEKQQRLEEYRQYVLNLEERQKESDSYGEAAELSILCLIHEVYKRMGNDTKRRRAANMVTRWLKCIQLSHLTYI